MIPVSLTLTDFGPFGENVHIDFTRYGPEDQILIIGENRDSAGADSNGSGKTKFFNGISWVLFGRVPEDIDAGEVVRRGAKRTEGTFILKNDEDQLIKITRSRKPSGKHQLEWSIDGEDQNQSRRTMKQTQQSLLHYFGILENNVQYYGDFLNTTYFSIDAIKAFAGKHSTSKERMDLISRFLNLEVLDRAFSRTKVYANNTKSELAGVESKVEFLSNKLDDDFDEDEVESKISEHKKDITVFQSETKKAQDQIDSMALVKNIQTQLEDTESSIEMTEQDMSSAEKTFEERLEDLESRLDNMSQLENEITSKEKIFKKLDALALQANFDKLELNYNEGNAKTIERETRLRIIEEQIESHLNCPDCETDLMLSKGRLQTFDLQVLEAEQKELKTKIQSNRKVLNTMQTGMDSLGDQLDIYSKTGLEIKGLQQRVKELKDLPEKIVSLKEDWRLQKIDLEERQSVLQAKKVKLTLELKQHPGIDVSLHADLKESIKVNGKKEENLRDEIARLKLQIENYQASIKDLKKLQGEADKLRETYTDYAYWLEGFPAIRRWMIESFLPSFEELINAFLSKLQVGMRVRLDTLKEKKSGKGDMKTEFDFAIIDENGEKRALETYSTGENKRIGVCVGFALRELTLHRGYSNFDFLLMDEVIDSLDETGISEFFGLMREVSGMKFLITHNTDLKTRFSNVIKVIKDGGLSTVAQS